MSRYILGIDAGGTKTIGLLKSTETDQSWTLSSGPGTLSAKNDSGVNQIIQVTQDLLSLSNASANDTTLVIGAAGITNVEAKRSLDNTLTNFGFSSITITSDARTSLYGAANGQPIIVIALGTGSVAMRLDETGTEKQFGGWGLAFGDQGSGAFIGREVIRSILLDYDKDDFIADIFVEKILFRMGKTKQDIASWLLQASTADLAALAPTIFASAHQSKIAQAAISKAVKGAEQLIQTAQGDSNLPLCILGGLAEIIKPLLNPEIQKQIIPAKGSAVDGAIYLGTHLSYKELNKDE